MFAGVVAVTVKRFDYEVQGLFWAALGMVFGLNRVRVLLGKGCERLVYRIWLLVGIGAKSLL